MLNGTLALHDIVDVERLCWGIVHRANLPIDQDAKEDLAAYLVATTWELSLRYKRGTGSTTTFAGYATTILRMRVVDWQRSRLGRGKRPDIISFEDLPRNEAARFTDGGGRHYPQGRINT